MSEATKYSPSPRPTTSGGPLRTATIFSGSSAESSTSANMPRICASARRVAPSRPRRGAAVFSSCSTRWATISVSVSVTNVWPWRCQLALQLEVVLDDAVVDDDDAAGAVAVGMGVLLGRAAVRGPARVADAVLAVERVGLDGVLEAGELPGAPAQVDGALPHHRDAGRVVAAVLEPAQAVDEDRDDRLGPDVADDAAHEDLSSVSPAPSGPCRLQPDAATSFGSAASSSTQPSLFTCLPRAMPSAPAGTSSVIDDPAAT